MNAGTTNRGPVLIFDSGVGGLSVMRAVHERLPELDFVYLADNAFFPYGDLSDEQIVTRVLTLVADAETHFQPLLIVIACNTASTLVLDQLRSRARVPVVGVVPAIKPAAALTANGRIGLLATPATVLRPYLDALIRDYACNATVVRVGSSVLVQQAEQWLAGRAPDSAVIAQAVRPLVEEAVDTVVLGCTHFPLIREALCQALPRVTHWVDSGDAIARRVHHLLAQQAPDEAGKDHPVSSHNSQRLRMRLFFSGPVPANLSAFLEQCGYASGQWRAEPLTPANAV